MEDERTFTEIYAVVKYKILKKIPMSTAKEEMMEDFINDWSELFGFGSIN